VGDAHASTAASGAVRAAAEGLPVPKAAHSRCTPRAMARALTYAGAALLLATTSAICEGWAWPKHTTVLEFEPGGCIGEHEKRYLSLASSGADVEVRGLCYSACTLIVAYIPKERLCFGNYASLNFHHAGSTLSAADAVAATGHMYLLYPREVREWIDKQGDVERLPMPFMGWWTLGAEELWEMGYRRCKPKPAPPMTVLKAGETDRQTR
jgi:hypothetical protein